MKNNIRLFKIIDPIVQSLLFILFTYSIDSNMPYGIIFLILLCWQLISAVVHPYFRRTSMLKKQRRAHLIVLAAYSVAYVAITFAVTEQYFEDRTGDGFIKLPIYNTALIAGGLIICFWYSVICLREIRRILKKGMED